jgi:hypothetical protein
MKFHGKRARTVAVIAGAAMAVTLGLGASPASAEASDGWVRGYDTYVGDWGDEGTLFWKPDGYPHSNATCLWQRILWAEGVSYNTANGPRYASLSDIDGNFGPHTNSLTLALQSRWGLYKDGKVGNGTFGRADDNLTKTGGSTARGETLYLRYNGSRNTFDLRRNTEGKYLFKDKKGDWRQAGYDYLTCAQ